jgi:hypothetical protein
MGTQQSKGMCSVEPQYPRAGCATRRRLHPKAAPPGATLSRALSAPVVAASSSRGREVSAVPKKPKKEEGKTEIKKGKKKER